MTGTASQIEWAEQIRPRVDAEFCRVAAAFRATAGHQALQEREETLAVIGILEEKHIEVMANDSAGYYVRHWQELTDQVRQAIAADGRYQGIRAKRLARNRRNTEKAMEKSV